MPSGNILSLKGQVKYFVDDYSDVISDTKRMIATSNRAGNALIRSGQQEREQIFEGGLNEISRMEKRAAEQLIQNKKNSAERISQIRATARPQPLDPSKHEAGAVKARQREIDALIGTAKKGHSEIKKLLQDTGADVFTGDEWSADEYAGATAAQRGGIRQARQERIKDIELEISALEKQQGALRDEKLGRSSAYRTNAKTLNQLNQEKEEHNELLKVEGRLDRDAIKWEKLYDEQMQQTGRSRKRIFRERAEIQQKEKEIQREMINMNREVAEEFGRVKQEVGQGLRDAFTFATVAIGAFWYKLQPVVDTFQEFEKQLVNAQSIWQESNDTLFALSDQVVEFGQNFGINMGDATEGLYQYASAGVEAAEAMEMLNHTLTLSMAVQGDHNTLAKLTTQTIMGFGMEFGDAAMVTDKFAHAINKSLIEWQDLASSVKFALPFFVSTGQSLDQLLGALAVLTNRALEAGIAGRGLRQALAEFTQHAEDNSAAFAKMGVEILDVEGNMRELTDIAAQFQSQIGDGVKDMDVMMALMDDLNIRGATAFVHLVQNADEFQAQVDDLQNSAGASAEMAEIQQKSLANQIQLVKNALQAPFLMSEDMGANQEYLNSFGETLHEMVKQFESLIVVEVDGQKQLTEFGEFIREFVIVAMEELSLMMADVVTLVKSFSNQGDAARGMLQLFVVPLRTVVKLLTWLGPELLNVIMLYKVFSRILPMNITQTLQYAQMKLFEIQTTMQAISTKMAESEANEWLGQSYVPLGHIQKGYTKIIMTQIGVMAAQKLALFGMIYMTQKLGKDAGGAAAVIGALTGAVMGAAIAIGMAANNTQAWAVSWIPFYGQLENAKALIANMAMGGLLMGAFNAATYQMFQPDIPSYNPEPVDDSFATGGRVLPRYATGGRVRQAGHFPVMVEAGETIISKTQNMARGTGGAGGVNIYVQGDVYDGDNFAEKVSEALPKALRKADDRGVGLVIR